MKEYGGYFGLEKYKGKEYHAKAYSMNSGRNSLIFILKEKNYKMIYIPEFLCDCIETVLNKNFINYKKYQITNNYEPILDFKINNNEALLVVNYFGILNNKKIKKLKQKYSNIIIDNTQSFFQKPVNDVDTIYSCRKYFGVPDGAYFYSSDINEKHYRMLEIDDSSSRFSHLFGRLEVSASEYYNEFLKNEICINTLKIEKMSLLTQNFLKSFDYQYIKKVRLENFKILDSLIGKFNKFKIKNHAGLFMYPMRVNNNANLLRKKFIENKIYVPILWSNILNDYNKYNINYKLANNMILLPIDQRYNTKDMKFIANIFFKLLSEKR